MIMGGEQRREPKIEGRERQDKRCLIEQGHGELRGREPMYKES